MMGRRLRSICDLSAHPLAQDLDPIRLNAQEDDERPVAGYFLVILSPTRGREIALPTKLYSPEPVMLENRDVNGVVIA